MRGLVAVSIIFWASFARAQDFIGTRALSLGEAYRANATGNDGIYLNPAGLTVLPRYSPEVHYQLNLEHEDHQVDASLVDSKTSKFAVGIGYTFQGREFTQRANFQHTATLAVAYPFIDRFFSVGTGLKYVNVSDVVLGGYLNALSADLGALSRLPGGVSLAAVGYNLIPIQSQRAPLSAAFAAAWDLGPLSAALFGGVPQGPTAPNIGGVPIPVDLGSARGALSDVVFSYDWHIAFDTLYGARSRMSGGFEWFVASLVPLRAGYLWDELSGDHRVSVGTGLVVPFFGLDVGFQQSILHEHERVFASSVKFFLAL